MPSSFYLPRGSCHTPHKIFRKLSKVYVIRSLQFSVSSDFITISWRGQWILEESMIFYDMPKKFRGQFSCAWPVRVAEIDIMQAEFLRVSRPPFQIIHERPSRVSLYVTFIQFHSCKLSANFNLISQKIPFKQFSIRYNRCQCVFYYWKS